MDEITEKRCSKCGEVKALGEYSADRRSPCGKRSACKECARKEHDKWYPKNKEKRALYEKAWRTANSEQKRKTNMEWRARNKARTKETNKAWRLRNIERRKADRARWDSENNERVVEMRKRASAKLRGTARGTLNNRMSASVYYSLRKGVKGRRRWESLVGYTVDQLKAHIEKQFTIGMTWEHLMAGEIHIDHKIPVTAFNFETPEDIDFKRCWALSNLRPMWAEENQRKYAKVERPFQPSLALSA